MYRDLKPYKSDRVKRFLRALPDRRAERPRNQDSILIRIDPETGQGSRLKAAGNSGLTGDFFWSLERLRARHHARNNRLKEERNWHLVFAHFSKRHLNDIGKRVPIQDIGDGIPDIQH